MQEPIPDLSQLSDIILPKAVSDWPMAYGWWLTPTAIVLLVIIVFSITHFLKKKYATRNAALKLLKHRHAQFKQNNNLTLFLSQCNEILKRYCAIKYPNAVSLSGKKWTDFLNQHSTDSFFNAELVNAIAQGQYQKHCKYSANELYLACTQWIKNNKHPLPIINIAKKND